MAEGGKRSVEYRILGSLEAVRDGELIPLGTRKQKALLALLLINANTVVSTDRIIDDLWGIEKGTNRQNALWVNVSGLRSALEPDRERRSEGNVLLTRSPGYVLSVDPPDIDATRFEQMALEGRALLDADPAGASLVLSEALALWRGRALEEFTYESFAQSEIARLDELRLTAVEDRIEADLGIGRARELVSELESLVRQHPLRERFTGHLMLALYRSNRQADALRAFSALRARLGEDLGLEPSAEITELEARIVTDDPRLRRRSTLHTLADRPEPGLAVRGYELRERVGEGALGWVYEAYQPAVGRTVAIRVIRPELANDAEFIRRFEAEARRAAALEHPRIVPLYDYWREPDAAYVVTRLFRSGSLEEEALARGPIPSQNAVGIIEQIGSALTAAHTQGLVHGDLKPTNVFLDQGDALVLGFGLTAGLDVPYVRERPVHGAEYAAPEVASGDPATIASDVYSLGMIATRLLAGATEEGGGPDAPLVGPAAEVIARATADAPDLRFPSVAAFLSALEDVLRADGSARTSEPFVAGNPYKGLRAFEEGDADRFFGRERLVERLLSRLGQPGPAGKLVALVGPSGAGKSSVARAGLIPAIRSGALPESETWFVATMTPGQHPFDALETALLKVAVDPPPTVYEQLRGDMAGTIASLLPGDSARLLLVVDQLEELFSHASGTDSDAFLDSLAAAAADPHAPIKTVVTLRADFYDRPLRHRAFGELLRLGTEVITPLTAHELERAITGPASLAGVTFEPGLVSQIVSDVSGHGSALPLMQYALTELFEQRSGTTVTTDAYRRIGGVSAALVGRADALYEKLDGNAKLVAREIFLRLVSITEGSEDTRRRSLVSELVELGAVPVHEVLDAFGHHRLIAFDRDPVTRGPTAEIAHEALLTEWSKLAVWLDEARADIIAQRRLATASAEWRERDENPDFLLTGARLSRYSGWLDDSPVRLTVGETRFLEASIRTEMDREKERTRQAARDVKLRRRTLLLGGMGLMTIVVVTLALLAYNARNRSTRLAATLVITERALRLSTQSAVQLEDDPQLALMLAVEAARATSSSGEVLPTAYDAIHWALQADHFQYPTRDGMEEVVRTGPAGLTGVFAFAPSELVAMAQGRIERSFTPNECARYFPDEPCPDPKAPLPDRLEVSGGLDTYATHPTRGTGLEGTTVLVTSTFPPGYGAEFIEASLAAISEATGIEVRHRNPATNQTMIEVVESDDAGDIAILPQPAAMAALDGEGLLMDVSQYLDVGTLRDSYGDYLFDLSSIGPNEEWPTSNGTPRGVFVFLDAKSLLWHVVAPFENAGYQIPATWGDLISLSDQIVADGHTPWCLSAADTAASGWPASDWVETAILRSQGPDFYDKWVSHEIPFDDPGVVEAVGLIGRLVFSPGYVSPSPAAVAERLYFDSGYLLAADPPQCLMTLGPNHTWYLTEELSSGGVIDVSGFPVLNPDYATAVVGGGTIAVALNDRPEVRAVLDAMTRPEWGEPWAALSDGFGFVPPNRHFDVSVYPTEEGRRIAELAIAAIEAGEFRYDGSDLMPPEIGLDAFLQGMRSYFEEGPDSLKSTLTDIETTWTKLEDRN